MIIPARGWHIERDADPGSKYPHRLYFDGDRFDWLTDEQADAFPQATPADDLPPGITMRPVLDAGVPVPDGWRTCFAPELRDARIWPAPVERIPAPATERVPWQQCIGRTLPDGKKIIGADETTISPRIKFGTVKNATYRLVTDGMVEVLVQS